MKYFGHIKTASQAQSEFKRLLGSLEHFGACKSRKVAKTLHSKLVKAHHPDKGGDPAIMSRVNAEYDEFIAIMDEWDQLKEQIRRYPDLYAEPVTIRSKAEELKAVAAGMGSRLKQELKKPENQKQLVDIAESMGSVMMRTLASALLKN